MKKLWLFDLLIVSLGTMPEPVQGTGEALCRWPDGDAICGIAQAHRGYRQLDGASWKGVDLNSPARDPHPRQSSKVSSHYFEEAMKTYHVENPGSIDGLALRDDLERQPGPNEVCVRIRAVSLNFRDLLIVRGQYPVPGLRKDVIPVSDGAGEVTAAGAAVRRVKVGDRVAVNFHQNWIDGPIGAGYMSSDLGGSIDGLLAESVILSEEGLVHLPSHLSFEEGAAFGCATITAWASLVSGVALRAGHTLLVQGTGGVSIFALQFAKALGARVIATTSSEAKAKTLRALGADEVINYVATPA